MRQKTLFCNDDCSGIRAKYEEKHGLLYISWYDDAFYREQKFIKETLKYRWKYIRRNHCVREMFVDSRSLKEFLRWLKNLPALSDEATDNDAELSFTRWCSPDTGKLYDYSVRLEGKLTNHDILLGRYHKMFDLVLNNADKEKLIKTITYVTADR